MITIVPDKCKESIVLAIQTLECKFPLEFRALGPNGILNPVLVTRAYVTWADCEVIDGREQGLQEDQNCRATETVVYA